MCVGYIFLLTIIKITTRNNRNNVVVVVVVVILNNKVSKSKNKLRIQEKFSHLIKSEHPTFKITCYDN